MATPHRLTNTLSLFIFIFPILAWAQNNTTSGKTAERVGWVSSTNNRSTSDILWSCFTIFLVCSWKCVHLHIPSVEESEAEWRLPCPSLPLWKRWFRKVKWMCIITLAPEIGVGMAVEQFMTARKMNKKFQDLHFTMAHGFYALMGGFVIAVPHDNNLEGNRNSVSNTTLSSGHQMSSESGVEIYCLKCKDFGKCFITIFLL
jgi:hypothetical protein